MDVWLANYRLQAKSGICSPSNGIEIELYRIRLKPIDPAFCFSHWQTSWVWEAHRQESKACSSPTSAPVFLWYYFILYKYFASTQDPPFTIVWQCNELQLWMLAKALSLHCWCSRLPNSRLLHEVDRKMYCWAIVHCSRNGVLLPATGTWAYHLWTWSNR